MAVTSRPPARTGGGGYAGRPTPSGLADVLDLILDKGLVIDAYVRVSLVGIELLTIDARIVIASVDTYLRFAEAVGRLDLGESAPEGLPQLVDDMTSGAASSKTKGALEGAKDKFDELFGGDDEDEDESQDDGDDGRERRRKQPARRRQRRPARARSDGEE